MPPLAIAGGAVAIGGALNYLGQKESSDAQQSIAESQLEQARQDRQLALSFAVPTAGELQTLQQQKDLYARVYSLQDAALKRQENLLNATDPALIEASQQAYTLLKGGDTASTTGVMAERNRQRDRLQQSLISQMGPGALTSTAGIQALNKFDRDTDQVRLQTVSSLLGVAQGSRPDAIGDVNRVGSGLSNLNSSYFGLSDSIAKRRISAIEGTQVTPYSGAGFVGDLGEGKALAGLGGQLTGVGFGAGGYALGGALYNSMNNTKPGARS